ncbi:MAG: hypothetical protein WAO78_09545 [Roseovarius sp.]
MNKEQILLAIQRMIDRQDFYDWYVDEDLYEASSEERMEKLKKLLKLQFPKAGNPFSD